MRKVVKMGGLVYKTPFITNLNFEINSLEEVKQLKNTLTTQEYDGLYQNLYEVELWDILPWNYRQILCPIIDYDSSTQTLTMPYIEPILKEEEAYRIEDEKSLEILEKIVRQRGGTKEEITNFLFILEVLCNTTTLVKEDILYNLSNLGYNEKFGLRVLDYGLSQELLEVEINV